MIDNEEVILTYEVMNLSKSISIQWASATRLFKISLSCVYQTFALDLQ